MTIQSDRPLRRLPPPSRIDRGVPGIFHRGTKRRRVHRRRLAWVRRERRLGSRLERELAGWAIALHSRLPGENLDCQPIDHLVSSPAGVWVVVADHRLSRLSHETAAASVAVRYRDVTQRAAACRAVLSSIGFDWLDVHLAVCATNARGASRRPIRVDDVWVTRPSALPSLISRAGPLSHADVATVAAELSRRFPAAH